MYKKTLAEELPEIGNIDFCKMLKHMAEDGQIKKFTRGEYCAFSAFQSNKVCPMRNIGHKSPNSVVIKRVRKAVLGL